MVYTVYDTLVLWDLTSATKPSMLTPDLALNWTTDARDKAKWAFNIREGTKFRDGSEFTAEAAVWNLDKLILVPLPMNEYLQQNLDDAGVKVNFEVMEWNTLLAAWRTGAKEQTAALQKIHEKFVNEDLFLDVTHDVNARAMSSKVKGFVQTQNWFQNFSSITMTK